MKKLFAILLTLAMLLGLAACGSSGDSAKPTIVGTWKGAIDFGPILATAMQMKFDEALDVDVIFTFNEDGTYTSAVDKDSVEDMMDTLVNVAIEIVISMSGNEDLDLEAELAKEGMTMAEFKEQMKANMKLEDMMGDMEETGYYKYEDGKFYTAEDKEDLDAGDYEDCTYITLTSNKMTVTDIEQDGEKMSEIMPDMFPMVFTKQ